jgi:hypothetical protein
VPAGSAVFNDVCISQLQFDAREFRDARNENGEAGIEREQVEHVFFERTLGGG